MNKQRQQQIAGIVTEATIDDKEYLEVIRLLAYNSFSFFAQASTENLWLFQYTGSSSVISVAAPRISIKKQGDSFKVTMVHRGSNKTSLDLDNFNELIGYLTKWVELFQEEVLAQYKKEINKLAKEAGVTIDPSKVDNAFSNNNVNRERKFSDIEKALILIKKAL